MPSKVDTYESLYPFRTSATDSNGASATQGVGEHLHLDAVVIGASWAGIWALHRLQSLGLRVRLLDACSDVGGVWWYTRYPGCRVDTEIPFYEFSKRELWEKWSWSERFPSRAEIHRYLSWVCDELDLRRNIIQNTRVTGCRWDETDSQWHLQTNTGLTATTQFILPCAGYSTIRHLPDFPGISKFPAVYHTSDIPEHVDFRGKRVAVIGTGASGIQVIEALSKVAERLVVFQRTPNLATPMRQIHYDREDMARFKEREYERRFAARNSRMGFHLRNERNSSADIPEHREELYEKLWAEGGLAFWYSNYKDMLDDPVANVRAYNFWRQKVRARVHDPDKAEILAPIKPPHAFGTKRPSLETAYFEGFNQDNVDLVDLNSDPIVEITHDGIAVASGKCYELDILALATGFDFITGSMLAMGITGRDGQPLKERWDVRAEGDGVSTYLGLMTVNFPNMMFPMGPQAPSALGLTPQMAEIQGDWIANLVVWMKKHDKTVVEPTGPAEDQWKKETYRAANESLFGQTQSWYMGVNIPGRKKQPLCYFGGVDRYIDALESSAREGYKGMKFR